MLAVSTVLIRYHSYEIYFSTFAPIRLPATLILPLTVLSLLAVAKSTFTLLLRDALSISLGPLALTISLILSLIGKASVGSCSTNMNKCSFSAQAQWASGCF